MSTEFALLPLPGHRKQLTFADKYQVLRKTDGRCAYCEVELAPQFGEDGASFSVDHVVPLARGGEDDISNWMPSCRECNTKKATKTGFEFTCDQLGIEVGWYARFNPDFDRIEADGSLFSDPTGFDWQMRDASIPDDILEDDTLGDESDRADQEVAEYKDYLAYLDYVETDDADEDDAPLMDAEGHYYA